MIPIASDLSYLVLQKRRERGELGACALDSSNQRLYPLPSAVVQREAFIGSRSIADGFQGEGQSHQFDVIPTWHFRGRKG